MKTGQFITLEGIEGCGKSLQMRLLEEEFRRRNIPLLSTREPGGTLFGSRLRQILLESDGAPREAVAELLLYLADRYQHLKEVIEPALLRGVDVLCDRYHDATLAYQGYARGIGFAPIDQLAEVLQFRVPDLTFVLEIPVGEGLRRARHRNLAENSEGQGRFEAEAAHFHEKVREGYRLLARRHPDRIHLIDASGTPQQVLERVLEVLRRRKIF